MTTSFIEENIKVGTASPTKMLQNNVNIVNPEELWSTCISAVVIEHDRLHYAQLGDCMILVLNNKNEITVLTRNTITGLDQRAREKRILDRQNNLIIQEESHFSSLKERLMYNRTLANHPLGYSVANGMDMASDRIQAGTIPLQEVVQVLMITDGFFHPDYSLEDTFRLIIRHGFENYAKQVVENYRSKSKSEDDMAGIRLELKTYV
jgi:serine/threonine protein phosphatase PrpC